MSKLNLHLMFFALIFVLSCQDKSAQAPKWKGDYLQLLQEYPKGLTIHFPKENKVKSDYVIHYTYLSKYSPSQFIVKQKESKVKIDSLISVARKLTYSDTSYYIVNKYLRDSNILSITKNYAQFKTQVVRQGAVPIPNFYGVIDFDENSYNLLNKTYTIYLIESDSKQCCSEKYHQGSWHMPDDWKDGFSRGYAINFEDNSVIYWLVIW
ncbi:hypothetical protein [Flavobacterium sp. K5-23]|uniref:hypothetical protein n=1 Tax=Flavobacterium sp. K5-23 TaxID=2746225 RepID=UPI00200CA51F|nr:hypothetical protein [Flavobacterium sp. K5-23]UQD55211.1 hypothetical protein FLAK523_01920 [Flavobacterium sp. K5-23]